MSDLHGGYDQLQALLGIIATEYPDIDRQLIFLGDYVDRGPKTRELLDLLMSLDDGYNIFLLGNHDDMALGCSPNYTQNGRDNGYRNWMGNGGDKTLDSYPGRKMSADHLNWLRKHPYYAKDAKRTYVHAGFYRHRPIEEQHHHVLTWIREEFLIDPSPVGGYVVHGHTPTIFYNDSTPTVDIAENRCNVDTGAVYGGVLSAAVFDDNSEKPIATLDHLGKHIRWSWI